MKGCLQADLDAKGKHMFAQSKRIRIICRLTSVLGLAALLTGGCLPGPESEADQADSAKTARQGVSTVVLALTLVPGDARCVRVTVSGAQKVVRSFDVNPMTQASMALGGLPLGQFTVTQEAFAVGCAMVTAETAATWVSAAPVTVSLTAGQTMSISIVLRRPAGLSVTADFQDGMGPLQLTLAPGNFVFRDTALQGRGALSSFTITNNTGVAAPFSPSLSGPDRDQFRFFGAPCEGTLAGGASCSFSVEFSPTTVGLKSAALSVSMTGPSAALSGTAIPGIFHVSPTARAFGMFSVGSQSMPSTFVVSNGTTASLSLSPFLAGPDASSFVITSNDCPVFLASNSTCTVAVRFAPMSAGAKTASLSVSMGGPSAALSGTAVSDVADNSAALSVSPSRRDWGNQLVGTTMGHVPFTVSNGGMIAAPVTPVIEGMHVADFAPLSSSCGSALAAGGTCQMSFTFRPSSAGAKLARLTIGPGGPSADLIGNGVAGTLTAMPTSRDFGSVPVGTTSTEFVFVVTNGTGVVAGGWTPTLAGPDAQDFTLAYASCAPPSTGQCLRVRFAPTSAGPKTATVASAPVLAPLSLSGTGSVTTPPVPSSCAVKVAVQSGWNYLDSFKVNGVVKQETDATVSSQWTQHGGGWKESQTAGQTTTITVNSGDVVEWWGNKPTYGGTGKLYMNNVFVQNISFAGMGPGGVIWSGTCASLSCFASSACAVGTTCVMGRCQ